MVAMGNYNPKMAMPRTLGSDAAGEVVAVGEWGYAKFKVGDRVCSLFFQQVDGWAGTPQEAGKSGLGESAGRGVYGRTEDVSGDRGHCGLRRFMTDEEAATLPCAAADSLACVGDPGEAAGGGERCWCWGRVESR